MSENYIQKALAVFFTKEDVQKARQFLKNGKVVYCFVPRRGLVSACVRNMLPGDNSALIHLEAEIADDGTLSGRCGRCGKIRPACFHAAAALLHLSRHKLLLAEVPRKEKSPGYPGFRPVSLKDIASRQEAGMPARLEVEFMNGMPHAPSKWDTCVFEIRLYLGSREYSGSLNNLRQLHFKEIFGVSLQISNFPLQERQIIRFLSINAESDGTHLVLNSELTAEFMHCLIGFERVLCGSRNLNVNRLPAEPVLACYEKGGAHILAPALCAGEKILPLANATMVTGKAGCWAGIGGDYWWIPATFDMGMLKAFFRIGEARVDSAEAARILKDFPSKPFRIVHIEAKPIRQSSFGLVYYIRSADGAVEVQLNFDYGGSLCEPGPQNLLLEDDRKCSRRDKEGELRYEQELLCFGFSRKSGGGPFTIKDTEAAGVFFESIVPAWIRGGRKVFISVEATGAASFPFGTAPIKARFELLRGSDGGTGADMLSILSSFTAAGADVSWKDLVGNVRERKTFASTASGTAGKISAELAGFVSSVWDIVTTSAERPDVLMISRAMLDYWNVKASALGCPPLSDGSESACAEPIAGSLSLFDGHLRNYQRDALSWMASMMRRRLNFILADEMGLGKTVQALALLSEQIRTSPARLPALVLCPSSLVGNWRMEASRFVPSLKTVEILKGADTQSALDTAGTDIFITSYTLLRKNIESYTARTFGCLILDEAQHIKNPATENAKSCKMIRARHRIVLTGTPLENSPLDLWSIFDFLHPGMLGHFKSFKDRFYSGGEEETGGQGELAARIGPFILRRKKAEVALELPPRTEQTVYCEMDNGQRAFYMRLLEEGRGLCSSMVRDGRGRGRMNVLTALLRLRQVCCHPSLLPEPMRPPGAESSKTELLKELLMENIDSGHKTLVFSQFTSLLAIVRAWLDSEGIPYEYLDGATKDRMDHVGRFNSDASIPLFLLSLKAGGTGLNLTAADSVIIYDPWWNPAVEDQAADRAHRIGQTRNVFVSRLVMKDSIEEKVIQLHERKRTLFRNLVENASFFRKLSDEDLAFLLG